MCAGAVFFGSVAVLSTIADLSETIRVAGWVGLVVLAFPAFMAFAVWRGWGDTPRVRD